MWRDATIWNSARGKWTRGLISSQFGAAGDLGDCSVLTKAARDNGDSAFAGRCADDWLASFAWRGFDRDRADIPPFWSCTRVDAVARSDIDGNIRLDWPEGARTTSFGKTSGGADIAAAVRHCAAVSVAGIHLSPHQVYADRGSGGRKN